VSTNLELCRAFRSTAGLTGSGPVTVEGQSGILLRVVDAIRNAWLRIQNHPKDWDWMWGEYALTVTENIDDYVLTNVGKIHRDSISLYKISVGVSDRQVIQFMDWDAFKRAFNTVTATNDRPNVMTVKPNGEVRIYPKPDDSYKLEFEYQKAPQVFAGNDDVPGLPEAFHEIIKHKALVDYGGFEEAPEVEVAATRAYLEMLNALVEKHRLRRQDQMVVRAQ
jgi:hypothetical protein